MGRPRQKTKDGSTTTTTDITRGSENTESTTGTTTNKGTTTTTAPTATTPTATAGSTRTRHEEGAVVTSNDTSRSGNSSISSTTGSSLGNGSGSPFQPDNDASLTAMNNDFMGDMDLDGVLASEMLDFSAFRDMQVPPLSIDCGDDDIDMSMGFTQLSDAASLLGLGVTTSASGTVPTAAMAGSDPMTGFDIGNISTFMPFSPASSPSGTSRAARTVAANAAANANANSNATSTNSSAGRSDCSCYTTALRLVAVSKGHEHSTTAITIDAILTLEDDTEQMLAALLNCPNCTRDPCVQLLAFLSLRTTSRLLRHAAKFKLKPIQGRPATPGTSLNDCNLYVGKFKVTEELRAGFVKQVISARMRRLLADLEAVFSNLRGLPQDAEAAAAIMVADETYNELQTIAGWIELWN
ncbi:hypothetical protein BDV96DRAFT_654731 [Lophiotrema nucula]|uniref:Aflatoxin regulatory protein domain-containing protein n=1 Tax=Lophiotrema nucula TaxID=690887 RepID=A0A6A5YHZ3_9PLEO|nr:hypothetical protein BDV96DRAFT_654731 [Lophiotrema nucula]